MFVKILDFLVHFDPFITTQKNGYIFFKIVFALTNILAYNF